MSRNTRLVTGAAVALLLVALVAAGGCTKVITTPAGSAANTVTASGTGTASAVPDTAEMSFGVTATSPNAKTALAQASKTAEQITAAVKKAGVAAKDIQTQNVSVYPQMSDQNGKQVINGYTASLSVSVKVRDIGTLGDVITAATNAGANDVSGPSFTVADPAPTRAKAIDKAVKDARVSAEAMARAAGRSVGAVLSISSSDGGVVAPVARFDAAAGAAKSVPIEPGQVDMTQNVTVIFELK